MAHEHGHMIHLNHIWVKFLESLIQYTQPHFKYQIK